MTAQAYIPVNGAEVVDLRDRTPRHLHPVPEVEVRVEAEPKEPSRLARAVKGSVGALAADFTGWRLALAEPPSLAGWLEARGTERVPDDWRLKVAWHLDHWTVGLTFAAASTVLFGLAATTRWVACHPARRWVFIGLTCTFVAWLTQA